MTSTIDPAKAFSGFAVPDVAAAKAFYGDTLGIDVSDEEMGLLTLRLAENKEIVVYPKPDFVPATYTVLNFPVDDIDRAVDELAAKGVQFLKYEGFDQDDKGIFRGPDGPPIAWFTDPAGNILSVLDVT
jgi:predicted enzyme related to lactoylglutathione lyase